MAGQSQSARRPVAARRGCVRSLVWPRMERWTRLVLRFRWLVLAFWLAVVLVGGWASFRLSGLLSNTFTVPGTDSERVRTCSSSTSATGRDGAFTVVFRVADSADPRGARRAPGRRRARRPRRAERPARAGSSGRLRTSVYGDVDLDARPRGGEGPHRRPPARARPAGRGVRGYVTGAAAIQHDLDPIFNAATCARASRSRCRSRCSCCSPSSGSRAAVTIPFLFAALHDLRDARDRLRRRALPDDADLRHEPRAADRARDRDRLLAADRLPLPRGARRAGWRSRTRSCGRWQTAGPRGRLLRRRRSRSGSRCCSFMPLPFMRSIGRRRLPDPARLDRSPRRRSSRRCSRSTAGAGRIARRSRSCAAPAGARRPATTSSTASGRGSRARSCGGRWRYLAVGRRAARRGGDPGRSALQLTPGSTDGHPAATRSRSAGFDVLEGAVGPGAIAPTQVLVDGGRPGGARAPAIAGRDRRGSSTGCARDPEVARRLLRRRPAASSTRAGRYEQVIVAGRHEYGSAQAQAFVAPAARPS